MIRRLVMILPFILQSADICAEEHQLLPGASIRGIEVTPRVTFIVPWQRSRMKEFPQLPSHSVLDDLYIPLSSRQLELDIYSQRHPALPQPK